MEESIVAEVQLFISKDHQRTIAMEVDNISLENLTKGDATPRPTEISNDISEQK